MSKANNNNEQRVIDKPAFMQYELEKMDAQIKDAEYRGEVVNEQLKTKQKDMQLILDRMSASNTKEEDFQVFYGALMEARMMLQELGRKRAHSQLMGFSTTKEGAKTPEEKAEKLFGENNKKEPLGQVVSEIVNRLRADIQVNGSKTSAYYTKGNDGLVRVNSKKINEDIKTIEKMIKSPVFTEDKKNFLTELYASLITLRDCDPMTKTINSIGAAVMSARGNADYKPLRVIGVLSGALLSVVGLGIGIFGKEKKIPLPTFLWLGILALSVSPELLASRGTRAIEHLKKYSAPAVQVFLTQQKVEGEMAAKAVAELFELGEGGYKNITKITKWDLQNIVEQLGIQKTSKLYTLLAEKMKSDYDRKTFFDLFSGDMRRNTSEEVRKTIIAYIQTRKEGREGMQTMLAERRREARAA